MPAHIRVV